MNKIIRWIQLSDWHVPTKIERFTEKVFQSLINDIYNICIVPDSLLGYSGIFVPDFIIHTGDIAFSGDPTQYKRAIEIFSGVLSATNSLNNKQLFLVPGNHDSFQGTALPAESLSNASNETEYYEAIDQLYDNKTKLKALLNRFNIFRNEFNSILNPDRIMSDESPCFADLLTTRSGIRIGIVGLCSAIVSLKDDEKKKRKMFIGQNQIEEGLAILKRKGPVDFKIILSHHPLESLSEIDQIKCGLSISESSDLLLRGHLHKRELSTVVNSGGVLTSLAVGASYENWRQTPFHFYGYALVELDITNHNIKTFFRRWSISGKFIPDLEGDATSAKKGYCEYKSPQVASPPMGVITKDPTIWITRMRRPLVNSGLEPISIFAGYVDRESHRDTTRQIEHLLTSQRSLDNKYLYWHVASRSLYHKLAAEKNYTIARESLNVCRSTFDMISRHLISKWGKGPYSIISFGVGIGIKETLLVKHIIENQPDASINLAFLDINYKMLLWAMNYYQSHGLMTQRINIHFIHADFDRIPMLSNLLPVVDGPTILMFLGGLLGNQDEAEFLGKLRMIAGDRFQLLIGVQSLEVLSGRSKKYLAGYNTESNLRFVELPLTHFDHSFSKMSFDKRRVKAIRLKDTRGNVPDSETIATIASSTKFGEVQLAFSRRYNIKKLKSFLEDNEFKISWDSGIESDTYWKALLDIPKGQQ